jgi:type IV secretory pathway VirB4 component
VHRLWKPVKGESTELGGPAVEIGARRLSVEGGMCQTLIVTGYPRDVHAGWAEPLLHYPGRMDAALHILPVPAGIAASRLRKRRARLESAWRLDAARGRVEDPLQTAATADAGDLAERIATGCSRLFRFAFYLTVHAPDPETLDAEIAYVRALASSMLVDTAPATFRSLQGWISTLPLGTDTLAMGRTMDTDAIAAALPFTSPELDAELGETAVVYGANTHSAGLVLWDRFCGGLDNHNAVILARSGAGKSYLAKLEVLRSLMAGVDVAVIDPEDEYARLAEAVGGVRIPLGTPEGRINPLDLPADGDAQAFTHRALFLHTLIAAMVGALTPHETGALDRAILTAYAAAGITRDPRTWNRTPPLLADLATALNADTDKEGRELAAKLAPYVTGSHADLFDGPSTGRFDGHLSVVCLRHLPDEVKTAGLLLALDALWRTTTDPVQRRPRMITVDEGWLLLQNPVGAKYLYRFAKAARKHWAGLTLVTQDVGDVLATDLGRSIAANAATQILLRQAPQNLDAVTDAFQLSHGERQIVSTAQRGEALLLAGNQRVAFRALASPQEDALITSDPAQLAALHRHAGDPDGEEALFDGPQR